MTEQQFKSNMIAAETFHGISEGNDGDFWKGYMKGLRRLYHGERFGTEDEHILWMGLVNSDDESRRMLGRGYRSGFKGQTVQEAMRTLAGPATHTCLRCGHTWRPRTDQRPAVCPSLKCKSPYWDRPRKTTDAPSRKSTWQNWIVADDPENCIPLGDQAAEQHGLPSTTKIVRARSAEEAAQKGVKLYNKTINPRAVRARLKKEDEKE